MIDAHRLAEAHADFIYKHAFRITPVMLLLVALAFPFVKKIDLKTNVTDLLPENLASVRHLNELVEDAGGSSFLVAAIESRHRGSIAQASEMFAGEADALPGVDYIDNRTDMRAFDSRKLLFLTPESLWTIDKHVQDLFGFYRRKNNPFYIDLLDETPPELDFTSLKMEEKAQEIGAQAGQGAKTFMQVILIKPDFPVGDMARSEILFKAIEETFQKINTGLLEPVTLGLTGPYKMRYDEHLVIVEDLKRTAALTISCVALLMIVFFRNLRSFLLTALPLALGIYWTCAFTGLTIGYFNLLSAFLLSILFGLGVDFGIHFLVSYAEDRKTTHDVNECLRKTFDDVGVPLLICALTTGVGFFSLGVTRLYGFRVFGLIAGAGILICFISVMYGLPSSMVVLQNIRKAHWATPGLKKESWRRPRPALICAVLVLGTLFSVFAVFQMDRLRFEYNFAHLQAKGSKAFELVERIGTYFGVVPNPVALITPNRTRAEETAAWVNTYIDTHPDSLLDFAASLSSYIPKNQEEKIRLMHGIDARLEKHVAIINTLDEQKRLDVAELRKQLRASPLTMEDVPMGLRQQYEGKTGNISVVLVYPKTSLLDGRTAGRFVEELRQLALPDDVTIAGEPVIYADMLTRLGKDGPRAMLITVLMVCLFLSIYFRRLKDVLWILSPVALGLLWTVGVLQLLQLKLNYLNVAIIPCMFSVGIHNGIHIFYRYKKGRKGTFLEIMHKTGKAVVLSSATTMLAFGSLLFADHRGMASLGALGLTGFTCCLLTSAIFMPALIEFYEMKYWNLFRPGAGKKFPRPAA